MYETITIGFIGDSSRTRMMTDIFISLDLICLKQLCIFTLDKNAAEEMQLMGLTVEDDPGEVIKKSDVIFLCNEEEAFDESVASAFEKNTSVIFYQQPIVSLLDKLCLRSLMTRYKTRLLFFRVQQVKNTESVKPSLKSMYCSHPGIPQDITDLIVHVLRGLGSVEQISELDFDHPNLLTPERETNSPENIV